MSQKQVKVMKRETRRIMKGYLSEIEDYLQPKPKWWPWWLWTWMQGKIIRMEKFRKRW